MFLTGQIRNPTEQDKAVSRKLNLFPLKKKQTNKKEKTWLADGDQTRFWSNRFSVSSFSNSIFIDDGFQFFSSS